jgi:hypothetical protein
MNKYVSTAVNNSNLHSGGATGSLSKANSSQRDNLLTGANSSNKGIGRIARGEYDKFSPIR